MKKEHIRFITGLLSNQKLSYSQRDKVVELALRDLSKNGSDIRILQDLELIKEKIGVEMDKPIEPLGRVWTRDKGGRTTPMTEEEIKKWGGEEFTNLPEIDEETKQILKELQKDSKQQEETTISKNTTISIQNEEIQDLTYYYPSGLYKYLFEYNQDKVLRSTCHEIDSNELEIIKKYCGTDKYEFNIHLKAILESFEQHEKRNFAPNKVKALIRGYLTGKDFKGDILRTGWSTDRITFSWSSEKLINWANNNGNFPPCPDPGLVESKEKIGYEFSEAIKALNFKKTFKTFNDLVIHFKHLFHIRQDNSLKNIFLLQNKIKDWNEKIDFELNAEEFPTNIELFTDVDKLIQAYNKILELILERQQKGKPKVKLMFYQTACGVELSIHHLNTHYHKSIKDTIERPYGKTYSGLIKNQLNGMCNLYVRADFGQQNFAKINIWDGKPREAEPLGFFEGVEHIFEFRKN